MPPLSLELWPQKTKKHFTEINYYKFTALVVLNYGTGEGNSKQ